MTTEIVRSGRRTWSLSRDADGHRTYRIMNLVKADTTDGPANVLQTAGLPLPGAIWQFSGDLDIWAWCRFDAEVRIHNEREGDPAEYYTVEQTFSTKPPERGKERCQDEDRTDPLLEPQRISGSFVRYVEEATTDYLGRKITNSAHEQIRGPQVEFDRNRPQVRIEQNVLNLELPLLAQLVDTVNDRPLWGLPARCIKLSNVTWERRFYGFCSLYYTRTLEFDINFNTWDRQVRDVGTKVLHGHWSVTSSEWVLDNIGVNAPDTRNPAHFIRYKDRNGENDNVVLDGAGKPFVPTDPAIASVTPATSCDVAAQDDSALMSLGVEYGPFTINPLQSRYFRVSANGSPRRVEIYLSDTFVDPDIIANGLVTIRFHKASDCTLAEDQGEEKPDVRVLHRTGSTDDPEMVIEFASAGAEDPLQYTIRVDGDEPERRPGTVLVQRYAPANLLLLGIPLDF